jgi:hypothetical protein
MVFAGGNAMLRAGYRPVPLVICGGFFSVVNVEALLRYWRDDGAHIYPVDNPVDDGAQVQEQVQEQSAGGWPWRD